VFLDSMDLINHNNIFVFSELLTLRKIIFDVKFATLLSVGTPDEGLNSI
jgi:hypothetical protein